jgi:predicted metal-dependent phosphoesterase TrpH
LLKVQLHAHTGSDPRDKWISYSEKDLIDLAAEKKYDVLSITCHQKLVFSQSLKKYAARKGILLIPGIEKRVDEKDVLIINATKKAEEITNFRDLKKYKYKNPDCLIIAPHPFYKLHSLGKKLIHKLKLFDAVEYSFFYSKRLNPNKKVLELGIPVVGTSDIHFLDFIDSTYTLVDAKKDTKSVIKAIKQGKIKIKTTPLTIPRIAHTAIRMGTLGPISRLVKKG